MQRVVSRMFSSRKNARHQSTVASPSAPRSIVRSAGLRVDIPADPPTRGTSAGLPSGASFSTTAQTPKSVQTPKGAQTPGGGRRLAITMQLLGLGNTALSESEKNTPSIPTSVPSESIPNAEMSARIDSGVIVESHPSSIVTPADVVQCEASLFTRRMTPHSTPASQDSVIGPQKYAQRSDHSIDLSSYKLTVVQDPVAVAVKPGDTQALGEFRHSRGFAANCVSYARGSPLSIFAAIAAIGFLGFAIFYVVLFGLTRPPNEVSLA